MSELRWKCENYFNENSNNRGKQENDSLLPKVIRKCGRQRSKVKMRLLYRCALRNFHSPNAGDQIEFCAFHSFLVEVQTKLVTYMARKRNNNLEIRIGGSSSSCRPQKMMAFKVIPGFSDIASKKKGQYCVISVKLHL